MGLLADSINGICMMVLPFVGLGLLATFLLKKGTDFIGSFLTGIPIIGDALGGLFTAITSIPFLGSIISFPFEAIDFMFKACAVAIIVILLIMLLCRFIKSRVLNKKIKKKVNKQIKKVMEEQASVDDAVDNAVSKIEVFK